MIDLTEQPALEAKVGIVIGDRQYAEIEALLENRFAVGLAGSSRRKRNKQCAKDEHQAEG